MESAFLMKFSEIETLLANKLVIVKQRVLKLLKDVDLLKRNIFSKAEANTKLFKQMEDMKLESVDNNTLISKLQIENNTLTAEKVDSERCLNELRRTLMDKETHIRELQNKNVCNICYLDRTKSTIKTVLIFLRFMNMLEV